MKKAILITCISLIIVLLGVILFLALYQKDFSYDFETPDLIEVNKNTGGKLDSDVVFEKFSNSSKKTILQSAFNKSQIKYPEIKPNASRKLKDIKDSNLTEKYQITFRYDTEQVLKLDGKNYVDPINSSNNEIKYKELRFELGETNKDISLKIYVMDLKETEKYYYVISQFGDYSELYSYLSGIENL